MSKEVDTKVIQLQFDNNDFEKGVKESRKSIGELDDSIKRLSDSANGSESVEKVSRVVVDKMTVMSSVINATITRLTNNVLDSAHKITHAFDDLTIAPVSKGFSKYEEQIGSVQTIMNATGKSIQDVQKQLDKLMWYTDETSYSYSDMAANIGKFTSAGVELDDAVTAMMGIANWAGVSGANVQQASRAMYNLSQAMGTGSLKLQDWMSIENANMATKEFKQTLIDTAIEIGVLEKDTEITAENMRETLKDGWVTADVLTKTLAKYGNYTEDLYKIYKDSIGTENELGGATDAMEVYEEKYEGIMEDLYKVFKQYGKESEEFKKKVEENSITLQTAMDLVSIQDAREYNKGLESIREALKRLRDQYGYDSEQFRKEAEKNGFTVREAAKMVEEGVETFKMTEQSLGEKSLKASQEAKTFKDAWEATIDGVSSSWLRFWQALFGNYEEARKLWTWLANDVLYAAFTEPANAIAEAMQMAHDMGSFEEIFEGFQTLWSGPEDEQGNRNGGIVAIFNAIKEAFTTIVPFFENSKSFSFYVYALTVRFREWAESITLSDDKLLELKETAEDIFTMLKAVGQIAFNLGWNVLRIIKAILPSRETILSIIKSIFGESAKVEEQVDNITNKITFVTNVIVFAITVIKRVLLNALKILPQLAAEVLNNIVNAVYNFTHSQIFKIATTIVATLGAAVIGVVAFIANQLSYLFILIFNLVRSIIGVIEQFKNSEDKIQWLKDQFLEILKIFEPVKIIFDSVIKTFKVMSAVVNGFLSGITDFISKIDVWRAALILLVLTLASNGVGILSFIGMVGQGVIGFVKNFIVTLNPIKMILHNFLSGIADAVDSLINIIDVAKIEALGHLIFTYALSVMLLSGAALMLSTIDEKRFKAAVFGTLGLLGTLFAFVYGLSKVVTKKTINTTRDAFKDANGLMHDITEITSTVQLGLGLIGIGFAAKAMAEVVKELGVVYDAVGGNPGAYISIIMGTAALFVGLFAGLALMVNMIKKSTETNSKVGAGTATINSDIKKLDGFIINLDLFGGTINKLALALVGIGLALAIMDFVDPDRLVSSAAVLGGAAIALMILSATISLLTKNVLFEKDNDALNKALGDTVNGFAKLISSLASGLFKITIALALLTLVDPDKLQQATYAIGTMSIALMGLIAAMTLLVRSVNQEYVSDLKGQIGKFNGNFGASGNAGIYSNGVGGNDILKAAFAIQMLSFALSTLSLSLMPMTFVDTTKVTKAAGAIGLLMTAMSGILFIFTAYLNSNSDTIKSNDILKIAGSIAIMAAGVDLIAAAILPLAALIGTSQFIFKKNDQHPIQRAADVIGGIIMAFAMYAVTIIAALGIYQEKVDLFVNDDTFTAVAKSLVMMAAGVDLIALAIGSLMTIQMLTIAKNEHSLRDSTLAIVAVMGSMSAMVVGLILSLAAVAKAGGYSDVDKVIKQVGILLTLMGAAVTIVTGCIAALSLIGMLPKAKVTEISSIIASIMVIMGAFGDIAVYMTSKLKWNQASTIQALGTTFVLMGTGIAIISAGIALIAYEIGKNHADSDAIAAAVWGLVGIFSVVAGYLAIMAAKADGFPDLTDDLLKIAGATGIMSLAIGIIAVALGEILQYGEDSFAAIGIFAVLIAVIGVYNEIMMKLVKSKGIDNSKTMELLVIAADFLVMSAAIALVAPALTELAKIANTFNGPNAIATAVVQGVIVPMIAVIGAVMALVHIANGSGGNSSDMANIISVSVLMLSMAAAMGILSQAAVVLASVDTEKIGKISASIVTTMVAFTICVGLLTYLSDKTGDSIPKLAISFLMFAASIWLVSEALDSMHTALANIANDPNVQDFGETLANFITEQPVAAAATAVGVGIGAHLLLAFKDYLVTEGVDLIDAPLNVIAEKLQEFWKKKLFDPIDPNVVGSGGLFTRLYDALFAKQTVDPITGLPIGRNGIMTNLFNKIEAEFALHATHQTGTSIFGAAGQTAGVAFAEAFLAVAVSTLLLYELTPEQLEKHRKYGEQLAEEFNKGYYSKVEWWDIPGQAKQQFAIMGESIRAISGYKQLTNNPLYRETWDKIRVDLSKIFNNEYERTQQLLTRDQARAALKAAGYSEKRLAESFDYSYVYDNVYDAYYDTYFKAQDKLDKEEEERTEESKARIASVSKDLQKFLIDTYNTQNDGQKHILSYEETIAALQEQYGQNAIKRTSELQEAYQIAYNKAAQYAQSFAETEKMSRESVARKNVELQKESDTQLTKAEEARITRLKAELNYNKDITDERRQYIQDELASYENRKGLLSNINAMQGAESQIVSDILTKDGARNLELSEQNRLLTLQTGILQTNNALQGGGLGSIISEVASSGDIIGTISKWINDWKDKKVQNLVNLFSGKGERIDASGLNAVFNQFVKGGLSFESVANSIKGLLGISDTGTAKSIFEQLGGGIIDFKALSSFDINDITGSLERLIKGTNEGKQLFNEIFGLDANNFSVDAFLNKIAGDLSYDDIAKKLAEKMGDTTTYESADWSKVTDVFNDTFDGIGASSADSFANSFGNVLGTSGIQTIKSPLEQMGESIISIIQPAADRLNEIIEQKANAAARAYTTAFEAAAEAYHKEFDEDTTLLGTTKSNIEAQAANIDDSVVMQGVYKRLYDYWNNRVKNLGSQILNADGTYKEGTEKRQKEYEEAVSNRDMYKSQLESERENEKALREDLKWEKQRKEYLEDPEKLAKAISDAESEKDAIYQSMVDGTFDASTDIITELQKANDKYDKLIQLQDDIGAELVSSNPDDEANAIHEGFDFNSKYSKAAWNALTRENNDITKRIKEIDNELTYLYQFRGDAETDARIKELEQESTNLKMQRKANKDFKDSMSTYEQDREELDRLNRRIEKNEQILKSGSYLMDDDSKPESNLYKQIQEDKRERDKLQARIDQLDSLTETGIEEGKVDAKTEVGYNTLALSANTDALNNLSTSLNNFGLSEEEIKKKADEAAKSIGDIPTKQDEVDKYLKDNGYTSMSEIQEQADKKQAEINAQTTASTAAIEQKGKEMLATAGVGASGANRNMLLSGGTETTSETTVGDIVVISNDVAAIRIASENILATLVSWRDEIGQHNAYMAQGMANIQNRGVPIANRMSFMNEVADAVDINLGNKVTRRARGN